MCSSEGMIMLTFIKVTYLYLPIGWEPDCVIIVPVVLETPCVTPGERFCRHKITMKTTTITDSETTPATTPPTIYPIACTLVPSN